MAAKSTESRDGVPLTNLDQELFDGAGATKRDLVDYLDAVRERILPVLRDRPLSVMRVRPGQPAFMQKNTPKYTPDWIRTLDLWAEASRRNISYALCDDRRTLIWFANQRAVEYHVTLFQAASMPHPTHLVLDLDPPESELPAGFRAAVDAAKLVNQALADLGLRGALKTSGAKGVHVIVPVTTTTNPDDAAAATRAIAARAARLDPAIATTAYIKTDRENKVFVDSTRAHGATVIAAYSPRLRPGTPVSFPVAWADADDVHPNDFTLKNAAALLGDRDPWAEALPEPQELPADLVAEGHEIPVARVAAMHEGKRRKRAAERAAAEND
ncbi:DNA polymerase domain-containing protein [Actinophytocola gossypii]|uniref:ATP-dependent DNA ligase n=1 Tax=Actinophytocola gossypii TaxID=2812003 RepID=A0ABT2J8Y1_9PSEU|nr:ATP-dependent DNA ligase [Actinophytocola gossypii]MCT2583734.1 ATP-dependent DNA ligase [Actinophytocola gossypii]